MSKIAFNLILILCPSLFAIAQFEPTRNFSVKDGLPSGVVYDCLQDKQGFMWFATAAGLARFDGANFKVFTTEDGLSNNEVLQIALDRDGSIWIFPFGTTPCIYEPVSQKLYNENNYAELRKLKDQAAQLFARNSAAGLIANAGEKSFFLENKKIEEVDTKHIPDLWPISRDSVAFLGFHKNYYLMVNDKKIDIDFDKPDSSLIFSKSIDWGRWKIFINSSTATKFNLYQFTNDGFIKKRGEFNNEYPINNIGKFGSWIYVSTVNGVYVIDSMLSAKQYFFSGKNISRVFIDKNGNEWLCSLSGEGVYMRQMNQVRQYELAAGLPYENVISLRMVKNNELLCGDGLGNIYTIDPTKQAPKTIPVKKFPDAIRSIDKSKNSSIIYSSYKISIEDKEIPAEFGAIKTVLPDTNGNLLIGTHWYLWSYNVLSNKKEKIKAGQRFVTLCYSQGNLYYGNNNGLFKIKSLRPYTEVTIDDGSRILNKPVNHLCSSPDGILWVATNTDGIVAIKDDKIIGHFNTASSQSLTSNICKKLYSDEENRSVWIATNKGVNRIRYSFTRTFLYADITAFTSSEGLNDDDVNDVYTEGKKVYAATIKGVCIFTVDLSKEEVPIRITEVKIKEYSSPDSIGYIKSSYNLSHRQNNISISYAGICFTCNTRLVYQYRMIGTGNDTSWKITTANTVEFGELKKGNYLFQVRTEPGNMQELSFHISPAFWQTNLFYVLVAAAIIGLFVFSIIFITRQIRKRENEKTAINKKFAELEFQALQAQMNPHFVFNAMNTLQNYILKNESENASEYLAKFARLMRLFLESSRNKFIELREEVDLLSNYIELEQVRLERSFKYRIDIDRGVEMDTKIPSVMIQPFVENAILHGLRYRTDNNGMLELRFSTTDHKLECQIRDNGIGRRESAIINKTKGKLYKSQALNIIEEKIRTLKEISNIDVKVMTEDNVNTDGKGPGTTVTIQFGLNK